MADMKIEAALQEIAERNNGRLLPEDVVTAAADPGSALHARFTWDDTEAAEKHRRNEARTLTETLTFKVPRLALGEAVRRDETTPERLERAAVAMLGSPDGDVRVANCFGRAGRHLIAAAKAKHPVDRKWDYGWAYGEIGNAIGWASR